MPAFKLDQFIGEIPRLSDQQIPDNAATIARNCRLLSGNLRALGTPAPTKSYSAAPHNSLFAYHLRESNLFDDPSDPTAGPFNYPETWVPYRYKNTHKVKGPVVKDRFERYYWTQGENDPPRYAIRATLAANGEEQNFQDIPGFLLGVPAPLTAPTVTPQNTGSQDDETRSYVVTFVTKYGEEGPPSPAGTAVGDPALPWDLADIPVDVPNGAERDVTEKFIYRTVVTQGSTADFVFVDRIPLGQTTYTEPGNNVIAGNNSLQSQTWLPPPTELDGLVEHPNGFLVGFQGFDVYFSEVFLPHAWPDTYVLSIETPIVALAVIETSIVVLTEGSPYVISGIAPDSMAITKIETVEPCVSRYSVVVMPDGVYYASNNGIARVVAESVQVVTSNLIDSKTWQEEFSPASITACRDHEYYLAFYSADDGFFLAPNDPANSIIFLDSFDGVENVFTDRLDGEVYYLRENIMLRWDPPNSTPITYRWKSKEFVASKPFNAGAVKVDFDVAPKPVNDDTTLQEQFNGARLALDYELNPINYAAINGSKYVAGITPDLPQLRLPLGGSSLFNLAAATVITGNVTLLVFARDELVFSELITSEELRRLPATLKSDKWQVELIGNTDVFYVKLAETGRQLAQI